ncbi:MAG: ATP-binding protein [Cyanobacteria bacterium P01_C01_bin.89]
MSADPFPTSFDPTGGYVATDTIAKIYSAFEPSITADPAVYVNLKTVRGGWDIFQAVGRRIERAAFPTHQLYSGHRGVGKSTELLRLKKHLEEQDFKVVYFAADQADIEPEDASYADVLLACTRNLLNQVQLETDENPILRWLESRWGEFKELAQTSVSFETLTVEQQIAQFAKLTANLRAVPSIRTEVRRVIDNNTVLLVQAVNEFIDQAAKQLKTQGKRGIVIMADNLDRITEIRPEGERSNHDQIYLDRCEEMKGLNCHVIYTVPMSLVCNRGMEVEDRYGDRDILPMVVMQNRDGSVNEAGLEAFREVIRRRVASVDGALAENLGSMVFESEELLDRLCIVSGGHMRILMQMVQKAVDWSDTLPIKKRAVGRAISSIRQTYEDAINGEDWALLVRVHDTKTLLKDARHDRLLGDRCILQYYEEVEDEEGEIVLQSWVDVHPSILGIRAFKEKWQSHQVFGQNEDLIKLGLGDAVAQYESHIDHERYAEASLAAEYMHQMVETMLDSSEVMSNTAEYRRLVALSAYWKLKRDLNNSRI